MRPETEADLAEAVAAATGPLWVRGGGTRALGSGPGQVLETGGLAKLSVYEPAALTLVAGAGIRLAEVEGLLAAQGQRLAFEPPDFRALLGRNGVSTLGGVIAANASGPRRVQAGAARDALLGVRFVDGRGQVIKNGGRVMKNVTGYDLVKLMAGSRGSLGVLTEVALKLQAVPEAEATLVVEGLDDAGGLQVLRQALGSPFDISGAGRHGGRSLIRVEGLAGSVAYRVGQIRALIGGDVTVVEGAESAALWRAQRDVTAFAGREGEVWRIVTLPTAGAEIAARFGGEAIWDWGGGLIWLCLPPGRGAEVVAAVAGRGHATRVRGLDAPVQPVEVPELMELVRGLKAQFDPRGILNPGVIV